MSLVPSTATTIANQLIDDALVDYALLVQPRRQIATLLVEVTVREVHVDSNTVTTHAVQTGTPVSDHVSRNPYRLEMTIAFSDSTVGYVGHAQEVYEALRAIDETRDPFSVSTGKRLYTSMVFSEIVVTTDATSEYSLAVVASMQEIIIASSGAQTLPADSQAQPSETSGVSNQGTQTPYPVTTPLPAQVGGVGGIPVATNPSGHIGGIGSA